MEPFRNHFSPGLVRTIGGLVARHHPSFDREGFETRVLAVLDDLELKQRVQAIADALHATLPTDTKTRYPILRAVLHPSTGQDGIRASDAEGLRGWGVMPLTALVGQHGRDSFDASLDLLKAMTKRFTAEFDVRHFIIDDQERALATLATWTQDPCVHVRRLVSEGTRPRLPWAMQLTRLIEDPEPVLPLLEALRDDEEEYVRRSVANHLNDIAKDHPDLVVEIAERWMRDANANRARLVRHACRTLIKQGHPGALGVFGHGPPRIELDELTIHTREIELGEALEFEVVLRSTSDAPQSLVVDYTLHLVKKRGERAGKVFKWKRVELEPGAELRMRREHGLRAITTRRYYSGTQALSLRINGRDFGEAEFELTVPD